jgi:Holliday junction DNA helicase RuvA
MIASIEGPIGRIGPNFLIINLGGVGVRVFVPKTVLENVGRIGRTIYLHTHFIVRETELTLYGFESEDDLNLFEVLISVNGVGPKLGQTILSTLSPDLIRSAIMREEAAVLQRVPGIGKKTAERILFSLRDKIDLKHAAATPLVSDVDTDVIEVLTSLGFSIVEAQTALQRIARDITTVDERVAQALRYLDQG